MDGRKKAISYALFGYGKGRSDNCFDFNSYLRGLSQCLRMNRLLYPNWVSVIHVDQKSYDAFKLYFDAIKSETVDVVVCGEDALCRAMLWRMKPIYETQDGKWKYSHVICRDTDSVATYREVQAVQYWIDKDTSLHAITDSISHNLPLMGGMIGVKPDYFNYRMECFDWTSLMAKSSGISFSVKGSDQDFLNLVVYPYFARKGSESITQHYFNGMSNTFLSDFHTCTCPPPSGHADNCPNNYKIDLPDELKESNSVAGHIGASGSYQSVMERFLRKYRGWFDDLHNAESNYPIVFYWTQDGSLG